MTRLFLSRRGSLAILAGAALVALAVPSRAAAFPDRPLKIVVPWPAGGLVDIPARLIADKLQAALGQPVVVDNKVGAGGTIGANLVAKAAPDGYTLVVTTSAVAINEAMQAKIPFDLLRDFQPVAALAHAPLILVTHPGNGPKSVAELIARARSQPGRLSYASAGNGSPGHLAAEWLRAREKLDIVHVAYKGAPPAMVDQMSGLVDFHFANAAVGLPQIRAGKVTPLAVASSRRLPQLPQVPTMAESGLADFDTDQWIGMLAPRGTPPEVVERLGKLVAEALRAPEVRAAIERNGMTAAQAGTPAQFGEEVKRDLRKWTGIVRSAGIKAE
jgi:tripartite-type tricarboxylate transporter receptor subunit TctC